MASIARTFGHSAIVRSAADPRQYRGLELTNGLRLLLVSDPDTDKASCAMDVNVGHMKDPPELPGLAHFCEHMLFLGTEKFPVENEYKQYLSQHGGSSNASTSREHTNYFFDVAPDHLPGAIERFAAFFTCPLFTESATEREVNAVDSENSRNIKTDSRRLFQLDKALARPGHDFGKFGTGNKDTLDTLPKASGVNTRSALLAFHQQWYSSNIMGCCVLGREDLDTLQNMLVPELESVENKAVAVPVWDQPPYTQNELQCEVHVVPIKDTRSLSIMWPIPDFHEEYKANPVGYLGHLLGHEGLGSLLSLLKAHGWSNHLSAGAEAGARGFAFFSVSADLTVEGQEHTEEIITMIYQYLAMLKREGPQQWVFYEKKDLAAMSFNFKDKETPRSYTSSIAGRLQQYPMSDILSVYRLYDQWKPQLIDKIMEQLVPQNMKVTVLSKKFEGKTSEIEKWYGTKYSVTKYTPEQLKLWSECGYNEKLALPPVNEFIPSNFDIVQGDVKPAAFPGILKETPLYRLWYKKDDKFLKPKATVNLDFKSPLAYGSPLQAVQTALLAALYEDAVAEHGYAAEVAGLGYDLDSTKTGFQLSVRGYSHKLPTLLARLVERLAAFTVDPARLEVYKEKKSRALKNFTADQPSSQAVYYTSQLTASQSWDKEDQLRALDEVTQENLQTFVKDLLSKLYIEGLMYGNLTKEEATTMMQSVCTTLQQGCGLAPLPPALHPAYRQLQLPDGCNYQYKKTNDVHESSCTSVFYQCGQQTTEENMLLELFRQLVFEPCFNTLRTKEQLGYIVSCHLRRAKGTQGLVIKVQSHRDPAYLESRIEAFFQSIDGLLSEMPEDIFSKHVDGLATKILEKPKTMMQQSGRYWDEIASGFYNFDRDNIEVAFLRTVSKSDVQRFHEEKLSINAPKRQKLCIYVESQATCDAPGRGGSSSSNSSSRSKSESQAQDATDLLPAPAMPQATEVVDEAAFKQGLALCPLPKPYIDLDHAHL